MGRQRRTPAEQDGEALAPSGGPLAHLKITPERKHDPQLYAELHTEVLNLLLAGALKPSDAERIQSIIASNCETNTGIPLEDVQRGGGDALSRFAGLLDTSTAELEAVEAAIGKINEIRASLDVKKKWLGLIGRAKSLQAQCREDAAKFFVYVCRDQETGDVFQMADLHMTMFGVWNDEGSQHSLMMAPPGHAKSTCFLGQIAWEIGRRPQDRHLFVQDTDEKARKAVPVLRDILKTRRFRAIFPGVRVIRKGDEDERGAGVNGTEDRKGRAESSSRRFTVTGGSFMSKDATFEGWGIMSRNQGAGCEERWGDDLVPSEARNWRSVVRDTEQKWFGLWQRRLRNPAMPHNRIRIVGHPWAPNDLLETIRKRCSAGQLPTWQVQICPVEDDGNGIPVPIWNKFTPEFLLSERLNDPVLYQLQYRLTVAETSSQRVRYLRFYNASASGPYTTEYDRECLEAIASSSRFLSIDPASGSLTSGASEIGVVDAAITPRGIGVVTDCWFIRGGGFEDWVVDKIADARAAARPYESVILEAQGGMKWGTSLFIENIQRRLREERGFKTEDMPEFIQPGVRIGGGQNKPKMLRLLNCKGYLENGMVRLAGQRCRSADGGQTKDANKTYCTWIPGTNIARLRDDIINFDGVKRSDGIDALTQWILLYRDRIRNPELAREVIREASSAVRPVSPLAAAFRKVLENAEMPKAPQGDLDKEDRVMRSVA